MLMNRIALLTAPAWIGTRPPRGVEILGLAVVFAQEDRLQLVRKIPLSGLHLHIIFGVRARPLPLAGHILQAKAVGLRLLARVLPLDGLAQPLAGHGTGPLSLADIPAVAPVNLYAEPPGFRRHPDHPLRTGRGRGWGEGLWLSRAIPSCLTAADLQLGDFKGRSRLADGSGDLQHDLPRGHIGPYPNGQIHRFGPRQIGTHV